ncbi:MAG TPA: hypothetical protein VNC78_04825 [Actinomycetota bacterium]|nr:hypothetical protein [Actinomycetota bacterium]
MDDDQVSEAQEIPGTGDVTDIPPPSATAAGTPDDEETEDAKTKWDRVGQRPDGPPELAPEGDTDSGAGPAGGAGNQSG